MIGWLTLKEFDRTFEYVYDGSGNISAILDTTGSTTVESRYQYDELNQLVREDNPYTGKTITYNYDDGGNIISKTEYAYTDAASLTGLSRTSIGYTYADLDWCDKLTRYNGTAITYDAIGNPRSYYNGSTFGWSNGRLLTTVKTAAGNTINYRYNADGIRTKKTVDGVVTEYFLEGSRVIAQKTGDKTLWFYYDAAGMRDMVAYDGSSYYYIYNAQGDVLGLCDKDLNMVVTYVYDTWGKLVSTTGTMANTLGKDNPFRYRGYYYDVETGLYYLQSRYYDPVTGRFLNADNQLATGSDLTGLNLFAYCGNNPVNRIDPTGEAWWHWALGAAVVAACAVATVVTCGGFAAAVGAVAAVGSGFAAATTASTIAAGAFIGSATVYGMAVMNAAATSGSVQEFNDQGSWATVAATVGGGVVGGVGASALTSSQPKSKTEYPPNNGFNATPRNSVLVPGSQLQRIGGTSGTFVAPINTSFSSLSLPPDKIGAPVMNLEVLSPISVQAGTAMPWFGQPGGGTQFLLPESIQELISNGSLRILP